MSDEGGINRNGQARATMAIVEARVVQRRADDGKGLDPERAEAIAGQAKCRDRASAERTIEPTVQAKQERMLPAIVSE
jgi:hypothetical protein